MRSLILLFLVVTLSACDANTVGIVATGLKTANTTFASAQTQAQTYTPCLSSAAQTLVNTIAAAPSGNADPAMANTIIGNAADCLNQSVSQ